MEDTPLYHRIAETLRQNIMSGELKPGDRLPSVREMAEQWDCTIGTAQRAYRELVRQGLVTSRPGQGTRVVERPRLQGETTLRRMALIHRAEAFLLEVVTAGYSLDDVERAVHQAMDRWRSVEVEVEPPPEKILRFSGSHDLVLPWLAGQFPDITGGYSLQASFTGRLGGLRTQQTVHENVVETVHGGKSLVEPVDGIAQQIGTHQATALVVGNHCISGNGAVVGANSR